ncbi:F-box protein 30 [Cichlidogyrus casuarinus]|uniref:F-box protein 30 n=1 Tax=Cichlidogyrus casuarinus TaxID=1844966 RepID=A0ABD2QID8_9PLAT
MDDVKFCKKHCMNCYKLKCSEKSADCECVECPNKCGLRLHFCKIPDHTSFICLDSLVRCPNFKYGCPKVLLRRQIARHLCYCPASVIQCSREWNRRPLIFSDRRPCLEMVRKPLRSPQHGSLPGLRLDQNYSEHFDMALTMHDQTSLEESIYVSDKIRSALKNTLTVVYPAIPLVSPLFRKEDQPPSSPLNTVRYATSVITDARSSFDSELPLKRPNVLVDQFSSSFATGTGMSPHMTLDIEIECLLLLYYTISNCVFEMERGCWDTMLMDLNWRIRPMCHLQSEVPGLRVDFALEFYLRHQPKPSSMYTFMCDQLVPRSSFSDHSHAHSDLHSQVDNWLEQRCPLSYRGCQFSVVRMQPNSEEEELIYNPSHSAFAIRRRECREKGTKHDIFSKLPSELLCKICLFLDRFSLLNLSQVNRRLGEVCKSLLPVLGIVVPVWTLVTGTETGLISWKITNFIWSYCCISDAAKEWLIRDRPELPGTLISQHLQTCRYYDKNIIEAPFRMHQTADEEIIKARRKFVMSNFAGQQID